MKQLDFKSKPRVVDFIDLFAMAMVEQSVDDEKHHGDTWLTLPRKGQERRIYERIEDYFDDYMLDNQPMPWAKIALLALIGWTRDNYPDLSEAWE